MKNNNNPSTPEIPVVLPHYAALRNEKKHILIRFFGLTMGHCRLGVMFVIAQVLIFPMLSGCALAPGFNMETGDTVTIDDPSSQGSLQFKVKPITPGLVATKENSLVRTSNPTKNNHPYAYQIGAADILEILVWNHPELTVASGSGSSTPGGFIVNDDGTIFFPYAGIVQVAGKTVGEVREELTQRLDAFIENPQVGVSVGEYRSKPVYMFGEVITPSTHFIDKGRVTLAEVIATAGGVNPNTSNPERIYVIRKDMPEPTIYWLKSESPVSMTLAKDFSVQAHDVVFVQPSQVTRWFRVLNQLLPSTSVITGSLGAAGSVGR